MSSRLEEIRKQNRPYDDKFVSNPDDIDWLISRVEAAEKLAESVKIWAPDLFKNDLDKFESSNKSID